MNKFNGLDDFLTEQAIEEINANLTPEEIAILLGGEEPETTSIRPAPVLVSDLPFEV